jgi:lysophospholipase L1-like esterase
MSKRGVAARVCALSLAGVGLAGILVWPAPESGSWRPSPAAQARIAAAEEAAAARPTVVLFVGDSYTAGGGQVGPPYTFAELVCAEKAWACYKDAQGGTGYTADGKVNDPGYTPYVGRLARTKANIRPDVVIVSGGRNDVGSSREAKATAAYLSSVRAAFPKARLVVLSPFWGDARPPQVLLDVRRAVADAAVRVDATVINTNGWLAPELMGPDAVHPTKAGHRRLADELIRACRRIGL